MDPTDLQPSTSNPIPSKRGIKRKASAMLQSRRDEFFETYQFQDFSLPDSMMFYITKNPSTAKLYEKMIQTCKNFYVKNPILVFSCLHYYKEWLIDEKPIATDKSTCKFWITSGFRVQHSINMKTLASSIIPKIFRCDVKYLFLDDQILSFDDLRIIIPNAKKVFLGNVIVKENDGTVIGIEKIVAVAVKAEFIQIRKPPNASVTLKTMKELIENPNFSKLDLFFMYGIPETFDIEAFYVYMKKNQNTEFVLKFDLFISENFKNRVEEIIDEIIATDVLTYKPPFIYFPGISREKKIRSFLYLFVRTEIFL